MTAFVLKLIAAISMFIDHFGLMVMPRIAIFRIIGRLAMPIYAYCIAEGFKYTKNRKKYFLRIFILGLLCQIVYTIVDHSLYIGILLTFSMSIILMTVQELFFASMGWENNISSHSIRSIKITENKLLCGLVYALSIVCVFVVTRVVTVDYGFFGVLLPVSAAIFPKDRIKRILAFTVCLILLAIDEYFVGFTVQIYSVLALIPIILYNGQKGKYNLKYFFYIFYPAHLIFIYIIAIIVQIIK